MRRQLLLIAVASVVLTSAGLAWMRAEDERSAEAAVRAAAIRGKPPVFESDLWELEEEAPIDRWSAWRMSVFDAGRGVRCWRFLVLPRGTSEDVAFRESVGSSACNRDRGQRYGRDPVMRACAMIGAVPPWRDRFVRADDFARSPCATP